MSLAAGLNWAWMRSCQRERRALMLATTDVADSQARLLHEILQSNATTAFGREHRFQQLRSPRDFLAQVPLGDYDGHRPWIERVARGEVNVLTHQPVRLFQPTSGTSAAEKLIPYTPALRAQYQRGIAAWIGDLYRQRPAVRRGRAYWSISPALGDARCTSGGIRIGFDDDAEYLSPLGRLFQRRLMAVPPEVAQACDLDDFRRATLLHLLAARDLSLVSIWNPSFLTVLLRYLEAHSETLCHALLHERQEHRRAAEVTSIFRDSSSMTERLRQLWPQLAMISCWTDASAAMALDELRLLIPDVEIQPKGLLATEGFVSVPLCDQPAAALAVRSHFFEFTSADSPRTRLAHELDVGGRYGVVITTGGGLYRYQLFDEVEVVGMHHECPLVRFTGKTDRTSDLVGEKLAEPFVRHCLAQVCERYGIRPRFALVAPIESRPPRYRLVLQTAESQRQPLEGLANQLESLLKANPYYRHAVEISQLLPVEVAQLSASVDAQSLYNETLIARGQRLGNIKPTALDRWSGWAQLFAPHVTETTAATCHSTAKPTPTPAAAPSPRH